MNSRFKIVFVITLGLLLAGMAFLGISSLAVENPLRVRVTKVLPGDAQTGLSLEVQNASRHTVLITCRWGVYEPGVRPLYKSINIETMGDAVPMLLEPGKTYTADGGVSTSSLSSGHPAYYYQWQPSLQSRLEGCWWRVRSMFGVAHGHFVPASVRLGIAEIEIPEEP